MTPQKENTVQTENGDSSQVLTRPNKGALPVLLPHTQVRPTTHTSGYWRLTTSTLTVRYLLEGVRDLLRDHLRVGSIEDRVSKLAQEVKVGMTHKSSSSLGNKAQKILSDFAAGDVEFIAAQYKREDSIAGAEREVVKALRTHQYAQLYDNFLGGMCAGLTLTHTYNTAHTIKKMYAETVALEMGKSPDQVTFTDLRHSKNEIVQNALHNAVRLNAMRLGSDLTFFGRSLAKLDGIIPELGRARSVNFGYIGLGLKGALLMKDITSRQATVFETLTDFADRKLNPFHGIADSVSASDIIDIYQKYAEFAKPKAMFRDITVNQRQDAELDWPKSEKIFIRVAELMNQSYKYKKSNLPDDERSAQAQNIAVNFTLPKYLHMLGSGMIDPYHPEETLTLMEVFARQNTKSLSIASEMLKSGVPAVEVAKRFGVETYVDLLQPPSVAVSLSPDKVVHAVQTAGQVQAPPSIQIH